MKVFSKLFIVLFSFTLAFSCCKKDDPEITDAKTVNSVNGRVLDNETGQGLMGATVSIAGAEASSVVTDPQGNYRFDKVKSGQQYDINVSHPDFYNGKITVTINKGDAKANDISLVPNKCFSIFSDYDFGTEKVELTRVMTTKAGKDINYSLKTTSSWIMLVKSSGNVPKNGNEAIMVKIDRSKLATGYNEGIITINHSCGGQALALYVTATK